MTQIFTRILVLASTANNCRDARCCGNFIVPVISHVVKTLRNFQADFQILKIIRMHFFDFEQNFIFLLIALLEFPVIAQSNLYFTLVIESMLMHSEYFILTGIQYHVPSILPATKNETSINQNYTSFFNITILGFSKLVSIIETRCSKCDVLYYISNVECTANALHNINSEKIESNSDVSRI